MSWMRLHSSLLFLPLGDVIQGPDLAHGCWQVELALVKSLASKAGAVNASQLEYVLQKVLLLLASMHQRAAGGRSPLQLQAGATVIFDALRQIAACQVDLAACLHPASAGYHQGLGKPFPWN